MKNQSYFQQTDSLVLDKATHAPLKGVLYVLVGPGGVGKNAVMTKVKESIPTIEQLPTATTRSPRPGEIEGVHHFFISLDEFKRQIADKELIEYQEVYPGKYYGTPRKALQQKLEEGKTLIADIEVFGARALKQAFPLNVVLIFLAPPTLEVLETRLRQRPAITEQDIRARIQRAPMEMEFARECDYQVVNDDLDQCVTRVVNIIQSK